jgi:predicted NBD/HSP70 family sugar kinase
VAKKATKEVMKDFNLKLLLKEIYYSKGIDRASLSKKTKLSPATVTNLVAELKEQGKIKEVGNAVSTGGRKPIILAINPDYRYVIGIKIGYSYINFMLSDLNGTVKSVEQKAYDQITISLIIDELKLQWQLWKEEYGIEFLGIGVAVSGVVDSINGTVINSYLLKWKNVKLAESLKREFSVDVQILNDVDSFALAQMWKGKAYQYKNAAFLTLGVGIGGSIILNGTLLSTYGTVTEFGHITVREDGIKCNCGSRGCLEAEASFKALSEKINLATTSTKLKTAFQTMNDAESSEIDFIKRALTEDKETVLEIFREYSSLVGIVLKDIINIFRPDYFLIGGEAMAFSDYFYNDTVEFAKRNCFKGLSDNLLFDKDHIGENAWTLGCIYKVIDRDMFNSNIIND